MQVSVSASKGDEQRAGCTTTQMRLTSEAESEGGAGRSFRITDGTAQRASSASRGGCVDGEAHTDRMEMGWSVFVPTETIAALRQRAGGNSSRGSTQYVLAAGKNSNAIGTARDFGVENPAIR